MEKVGEEGVIAVKEECITEDEIKITEGMRFNHGPRLHLALFRCQHQSPIGRIREALHPAVPS